MCTVFKVIVRRIPGRWVLAPMALPLALCGAVNEAAQLSDARIIPGNVKEYDLAPELIARVGGIFGGIDARISGVLSNKQVVRKPDREGPERRRVSKICLDDTSKYYA